MSGGTALIIALVLLMANAYFVGAEFALISARRTTIETRAANGSRAARTTLSAMENVSLMLAGAQLGITAASLGLGAIGEPALAHLIEPLFTALHLPPQLVEPVAFALALAIVVFLHVVFGEMVPKNMALIGPDRAALILAPPLVVFVRLVKPVLIVLNAVANVTLRAIHVQPRDEVSSTFTRDEVAGFIEQSHREGLLEPDEHDLLVGALSLDEGTARNVMLPLADLQTVPVTVTPQEVEGIAGATGFSRLPVQAADGNLVGYVHLKDMLYVDVDHGTLPIDTSLIRALAPIGPDDHLRGALATMQRSGAHLGQVLDADGATLGVVALEDVLEELVGEIRDETRRQEPPRNSR